MLKKFDNIPDAIQKKCVSEIITRVEEIEDSTVGIITAQEIIDIVTANYGPEIYNMALHDTKKMLQEKISDIEFELNSLKQ